MKIVWHTPMEQQVRPDDGRPGERVPSPQWPDGWPVPRIGDDVDLGPLFDGLSLKVTVVDWFPAGEDDGDEPFVYVVLR
jgi:hypothetical protein